MVWDVVVVGAGPAGSSAARAAADAGVRVLLIDRATFPRYKTCGGGITGRSLAAIPASVIATFEDELTEFGVSREGADRTMLHDDDPFVRMVQRDRFDQALVDEAVAAGAEFRDGTALRSLEEGPDGVRVRLADEEHGEELLARVVIGADGCSGRTSAYVGVQFAGADLGLEVELDAPDHDWAHTGLFDWGRDAGSYGWLFPKHDALTVGVIQRTGVPDATRAYLELWLQQLGLTDAVRLRETGHLTKWRSVHSPLRRGAVLVAGEAAGLLEPWTREGISWALRSGSMAGAAAASAAVAARAGDAVTRDEALDGYVATVKRVLAPDLLAGAAMLRWFELAPGSLHRIFAHTRGGGRLFIALCRGQEPISRLVQHPLSRVLAPLLGRRARRKPARVSRARAGREAGRGS